MTKEINNISQIIRSTEEYSDVCDMCRDEILLYLTISGRTEYSQDEVEQITLKRIIDKLRAKDQECKNLEEELRASRIGIKDISIESTEICKISEKYKQALDNIEARIQLENADDCLLDVMEIIESVKEKNNDSLPTKVLCKLHKTSI